jgi:hypothetical protein
MSAGSITLGGNLSVAVGPLGRNAEGSGALNTKGQLAAMYSYSKTKGLFGGVSVEGSVFTERQDANRLAYGGKPTAKQILTGAFDPPDWAFVLIDELDRCTGIPGGHNWVQDNKKNEGAMGWSSPVGNGKTSTGYAFGEGVGAGGTTSKGRKRSSSLFSLGGGNKTPVETGAVFASRPPNAANQLSYASEPRPELPRSQSQTMTGSVTPPNPESRAAPSRPWESRRASTYLPFTSKSLGKSNTAVDRKAGPSSETYNAGYVPKPATRSRAGSIQRPYVGRPTPSPFSDFGSRNGTPADSPKSSPMIGSSDHEWGRTNGTDSGNEFSNVGSRASSVSGRSGRAVSGNGNGVGRSNTNGSSHPNGSGSSSSEEPDLLGAWDANDRGLTPTFARLNMRNGNHGGSLNGTSLLKSRRSSTLPFEDIAEDPNRVRLRETTSSFASKDWVGSNGRSGRRAFSTYGAPEGWPGTGTPVRDGEHNPFQEREYDFSRPFDDYTVPKRKSSRAGAEGGAGAGGMPFAVSDVDPPSNGAGEEEHARAVALFDFKATEGSDLGLKKGQVVLVLATADSAAAWWRGRLQDSDTEGIFPANHVEVLHIPRQLPGGITKTQLRTRLLTGLEFD